MKRPSEGVDKGKKAAKLFKDSEGERKGVCLISHADCDKHKKEVKTKWRMGNVLSAQLP